MKRCRTVSPETLIDVAVKVICSPVYCIGSAILQSIRIAKAASGKGVSLTEATVNTMLADESVGIYGRIILKRFVCVVRVRQVVLFLACWSLTKVVVFAGVSQDQRGKKREEIAVRTMRAGRLSECETIYLYVEPIERGEDSQGGGESIGWLPATRSGCWLLVTSDW